MVDNNQTIQSNQTNNIVVTKKENNTVNVILRLENRIFLRVCIGIYNKKSVIKEKCVIFFNVLSYK